MTEKTEATAPPPPPRRASRFKAPGILIAISAVLALLGCGLCSAGGMRFDQDSVHPIIVNIGAITFWGGVLGFIFGFLWFFITLFSGPGKERLP